MTSTPKKTTSSATKKETPAEPTPEKPTRSAAPKKSHVLYQLDGEASGSFYDVRVFGDKTRAWEALATTHTGADGWKYVAVEVGASVADAITATQESTR